MTTETTGPGDIVTGDQLSDRLNLSPDAIDDLLRIGQVHRGWAFPPDYPPSRVLNLRAVYLDDVPDYLAELLKQSPIDCRRRSFRNLRLVCVILPAAWSPPLSTPPAFLFDTGMHFRVPDGATGVPYPACMVFHDGARHFVLVDTSDAADPEDARIVDLPLPTAEYLVPGGLEALRLSQQRGGGPAMGHANVSGARLAWLTANLRKRGSEVPPPRSRGGQPGIKAELRAEALKERPDLFTGSSFNRTWTELNRIKPPPQ